jgi:hypothetical protein
MKSEQLTRKQLRIAIAQNQNEPMASSRLDQWSFTASQIAAFDFSSNYPKRAFSLVLLASTYE